MDKKIGLTEWQKLRYTHVFVSIFYNNSFRKKEASTEPSTYKKVLMTAYNVCTSHFGLVILLVLYSFIGAAIFQAIEGKQHGLSDNEIVTLARSQAISSILSSLNVTVNSQAEGVLLKAFEKFEANLTAKHILFVYPSAEEIWDFWGSLFYCATTYTTIGYGDMFPVTKAGMWLTIVYSLFGIPLCLITIANLGILFTTVLTIIYKALMRKCCCCKFCTRSTSDPRNNKDVQVVIQNEGIPSGELKDDQTKHDNNEITNPSHTSMADVNGIDVDTDIPSLGVVKAARKFKTRSAGKRQDGVEKKSENPNPIKTTGDKDNRCCCERNMSAFLPILITVIYMLFGVLMYSRWEDWNFTEAFYFLFISLSTIGFGDIVPEHRNFFLASGIYILFGLSLVAMTVSSLMQVTSTTLGKAKEKVDMLAGKGLGVEMTGNDSMHKIPQ